MPADLRRALRALRARPALTLGLLLTPALGVGANAAMLGALDALLLRAPAGVRDAGGVARLAVRARPGEAPQAATAYPFFAAVRERAARPGGALKSRDDARRARGARGDAGGRMRGGPGPAIVAV